MYAGDFGGLRGHKIHIDVQTSMVVSGSHKRWDYKWYMGDYISPTTY